MKGCDYFEEISAGAISKQMPDCKAIILNIGEKREITECLHELYSGENYKIYTATITAAKLGATLKRCKEAGIPVVVNCGEKLPDPAVCITEKQYAATLISPGSYTGDPENILRHILSDKKALYFSNIGYQGYRYDPAVLLALRNKYFEDMRLGIVRNDLTLCEPLIRDTQYAFFDLHAIRYADYPYAGTANPNGLYAEEACTIARYMGLARKMKAIFLFGEPAGKKTITICNKLVAEIIWHICEGLASNLPEDPANKDFDDYFSRKIVSLGQNGEEIGFVTSNNTGRWWMEIPAGPQNNSLFIPCSIKDYQTACTGEIPLRWLFFYQKYALL